MLNEKKRRFSVVTNENYTNNKTSPTNKEIISPTEISQNTDIYQTNPLYEKLLSFKELQKKRRFTVDDLLKW